MRDPASFRAALLDVPPNARDAWLDRLLGLGELPDDDPRLLPPGCVPYLPCAVDVLLRVVEEAPVRASDVVVDVGAGAGRAGALIHLLTGASVIGLEIQPSLVARARALAERLHLSRVSFVEGDAATLASDVAAGTVFFLYCPFGGERLARLVDGLEPIARTRPICLCCVDAPLPLRPWLVADPPRSGDLTVHRSLPRLDV